ncbi:hypothetical protein FGIG_01930 [Fasciola gigantica]|uniref:MD-2-related lipid-recognition domain-containing protein n=1 Tax=Fasciola gigantica TaxID=46835 RepID=A0A504Z0T8_FASGI|nr:hypothetical protein FGIG_01930 [Fasciola gigantica]
MRSDSSPSISPQRSSSQLPRKTIVEHIVNWREFVDCGSKRGQLINVTVTPCDTTPCSLYRGEKAQVSITFRPHENITTGTASVRGIFAHRHIPIPIPLADNDLCKFTNPPCEIPAQTEVPIRNWSQYTRGKPK